MYTLLCKHTDPSFHSANQHSTDSIKCNQKFTDQLLATAAAISTPSQQLNRIPALIFTQPLINPAGSFGCLAAGGVQHPASSVRSIPFANKPICHHFPINWVSHPSLMLHEIKEHAQNGIRAMARFSAVLSSLKP